MAIGVTWIAPQSGPRTRAVWTTQGGSKPHPALMPGLIMLRGPDCAGASEISFSRGSCI